MTTQQEIPHPPIVSREEWLAERKKLLIHEKEVTRHADRVSAERRRLPMVKVDKDYVFEGPEGTRHFSDLFESQRQLIVYHFMFDPDWDKGCPGCTGFVDALGDISHLAERDARLVLISRAPRTKITAYKESKGWSLPWYSSFGSDFNYDFHATLDESIAPLEYNYRTAEELERTPKGEQHGISVFLRTEGGIYHTYSSFARGVEALTDTYKLLDITPYGRQEDWEDSPPGWPQRPTYGG